MTNDLPPTQFPGEGSSENSFEQVESVPSQIGRFRIERIIGKGGFGNVYLAHDAQLQRLVAIKVSHRVLVDRPETAESYMAEARSVANLDHPNIVPVYDVGSTDEFPVFIVSKYIAGTDLATRLRQSRLSLQEVVELIATVAEALNYAHVHGLVHRDIKPGNLLLDKSGKPFVADFGLALREQDVGKGPRYAGTPAYMSPEQARGEGHRVDGRSDNFSLGVVLYEMLTGRQPFRGDSRLELMQQVTNHEPRPLRQVDDSIPKELERICFNAMAKRVSERYMTAKDFAEDLRRFQADMTFKEQYGTDPNAIVLHSASAVVQPTSMASALALRLPTITSTLLSSVNQPLKIVPKGLRSFDAHDADFFLELLPGPRDREGLPDSLRFWKTRIEEVDADGTFAIGLIYGPSGCGKSSLMKAGLLPRLSDDVITVYLEATAYETETRLLNGLRKRVSLPDNLNLKDTLAALRRGQNIPLGKKVLIVLDQFEQWLHANKVVKDTELVQALRQCDGGRVQCIVMVRDDFWLAISRFLRDLEIRLVEGQNSALADLFDLVHAKKVLAAFGRAFGKLAENSDKTTVEQEKFLNQAVSGLAQEGKVICVRLALFAEMMKGKAWTPASLNAVGGTEGVGVTFLEETFSASTAPPEHRYHQKAARADLQALLPESGSDLKGHMRSYSELLEASGYINRPNDFEDLIRILDSEIRLITPTDPDGKAEAAYSSTQSEQRFYQLTHDFLVHSLRQWLTRKQKETRRGRAELLLADRAAVWTTRPENRQLPSLLQYLTIRWWVPKKTWTPPQKAMVAKAISIHAKRGLVLGLLLSVIAVTAFSIWERVTEQRKVAHAISLVRRVLDAETAIVPSIVGELAEYREWTGPLLKDAIDKTEVKSRQKLHASLALLAFDDTQVDFLYNRLLDAEPHEVPAIRDALSHHKVDLLAKLWAVVAKPENGKESQRLRAAAALAMYDPENENWEMVQTAVCDDFVNVPTVFLASWIDAFRPVRNKTYSALSAVFRDTDRMELERSIAMDILCNFAADQPHVLADLLMDADETRFTLLNLKFKELNDQFLPMLINEIDKKLPPGLPSIDVKRERLAKRQANAAVALLRMNQPQNVWPLFQHSTDPRVRSYLIDRLSRLGVEAKLVVCQLNSATDISIRRALVLSLGEFSEKEFTAEDRDALLPELQEMYQTESDPGLHAAVEWLLCKWKHVAWLKEVNEEWAADSMGQDKTHIVKLPPGGQPTWHVNGQGQTLVVIPGPVEFVMGSPDSESGRSAEQQHTMRIGRSFAIGSKAITVEEFKRFNASYSFTQQLAPMPDCPVISTTWFDASAYCNWLSQVEGFSDDQLCYEITGETTKLRENYLSLTGYRLATEAEMEYATRAGALTCRFFGETDVLLPKYAWYAKNSEARTWPVGSLKPNDLGFFDVQGNAFTWCQEAPREYLRGDAVINDVEGNLAVTGHSRALRGGSFVVQQSYLRSAARTSNVPTDRYVGSGIRVARTIP